MGKFIVKNGRLAKIPTPRTSSVKKWMWQENMASRVGNQLWLMAIRDNVSGEKILQRLARHGIKMTPETLKKILRGNSPYMNQMTSVALAIGYTLAEVIQQADAMGSPAEIKKSLAKSLGVKLKRQPKE